MELLENEQIKPIPNWDKYYITSFGRVWSEKAHQWMTLYLRPSGYQSVAFRQNGKQKQFLVHRLVAENFIENPNNYPQVNHKDENKTNNNIENLEWCTAKYNSNYGTRTIKTYKAIMMCDIKTHQEIQKFNSVKEAFEFLNVKYNGSISDVLKGNQHSAYGYFWKYAE